MAVNTTTIDALRQICENCATRETDKFIGNQRFEARVLDREESFAARRGILETSQMMSNGLMVAVPDAIDGKAWKWEEILPGVVHSRATGGLAKTECGFDPQALKKKHAIKRQQTERMYIHREECMLNYIGSTLQEGDTSNGPIYIRNNDDLITIGEARGLVVDLMVNDMRAMARAVDGNSVLGNWAGDGATGTIVNGGASLYPHFDGVIKQALLQGNNAYYASVDVTLPAVGAGAYFIKFYGQFSASAASVADVVTAINGLRVDSTGEYLYSATDLGGNVVRITANTVESAAYGEGLLQVYYSATGQVTDCDDFVSATIVENPMPYAENPLMFNYSAISESNFYDYFKDVVKEWRYKMTRLYESGVMPQNLGTPYVAIDPLILIEKDFSYLRELCGCDNAEERLGRLDSMFPRFVGLKVLEGSGLWFMTYPTNVVYLTNFQADMLGVTKIWHDEDCDLVKSRNEMVGNILVLDFALFATNAKGSFFESALTPPYQPENIPHLAHDIRQNTIQGFTTDVARALASVTYATGVAAGTIDLRLQDVSALPDGVTVTAWNWVVYTANGTTGTQQPATQVADVTVNMTDAEFAAIQMVALTATFSDGTTDTVVVPNEAFVQTA